MASRLLLLDTASLYFRAFHGVPESVRAADGRPVNAVRGLLDMIARLVSFTETRRVVACWDEAWRPSWRVELVPSYKRHRVALGADGTSDPDGREEMPAALLAQLPIMREILAALGIPVVGAPDAEADDVIAALTRRERGAVDIVTGDRDLFQLVDDTRPVRVVSTSRGMAHLEVVTEQTVRERYGVPPHRYVDVAVLRGDPSDGLPGVTGVGDKTAARLVAAFGSLEQVIAAAHDAHPRAGMSAAVAARLRDAAGSLDAALRVVRLDGTLPLPTLTEPSAPDAVAALALAGTLGLDRPMARALDALTPAEAP